MYNEVNLSRHAKFKREVLKEGMCQRDTEYDRNTFEIYYYIINKNDKS